MILEILDHDGAVHVHTVRPVFSRLSAAEIVIAASREHLQATLYDDWGATVAVYRNLYRMPPVVLEEP